MNPGEWSFGDWLIYSVGGTVYLCGLAFVLVLTVAAIWDAFHDDRGRR